MAAKAKAEKVDLRRKQRVPSLNKSLPMTEICDGTATVAQVDWASLTPSNRNVRHWPDDCEYLIRSSSFYECKSLTEFDFQALVDARCTTVLVHRAYDYYIVKKSLGASVSWSDASQTTPGPRHVPEPNVDARYDLVLNKLRNSTRKELSEYWETIKSKGYGSGKAESIRWPQTWARFVHRRVFRTVGNILRREVFVSSVQEIPTVMPREPRPRRGHDQKPKNKRNRKGVFVHIDLSVLPGKQDLSRYLLYKIGVYLSQQAKEAQDQTHPLHRHAAQWDRQAQIFAKLTEGYDVNRDRKMLAEMLGVTEAQIIQDWESLQVKMRRLRKSDSEKGKEIRELCDDVFSEKPLYNSNVNERIRAFFGGDLNE